MKLLDLMPFDNRCASDLPSTHNLLTSGGDARIAIGSNGFNRYGCRTTPDPQLLPFGSSTASTISQAGFIAADRLREKLQSRADRLRGELYAEELDRVRDELATLCGIDDEFRPSMIFAASGTDLHLIAVSLVSRNDNRPLQVIIAGIDETGRGVPAAVTGRHFSSTSALGSPVAENNACLTHVDIRLHTVPIRTSDGTARAMCEVEHEVEMLVSRAVAAQHRVLLIVVDVSKTGIIAPSPACAINLRDKFPDSVDLMVDACQFRMAPPTLQGYLQHGFMVALTGSKFLTGPTFSGVVMVPEDVAQSMRQHALPAGLAAYSCRADWPTSWSSANALEGHTNFGLLLRWEAALAELRQFAVIPERHIKNILSRFAHAVATRLRSDLRFEPLPLPVLDRAPVADSMQWDSVPTIFPFIPCRLDRHGRRHMLSRDETARLYQNLQRAPDANSSTPVSGLRLNLGQPVPCGSRNGVELSALRLCMSARLLVDAAASGNEETMINHAMRALDEVARLVARTH